MAEKWVTEGETLVADILFGTASPPATLYLGLYKNVTEPAEDITLAGLSEVNGTGYARLPLARGSWSLDEGLAAYAEQTFAAGSTWAGVTGYFVCNVATGTVGKVLCIGHFDTAYDIEAGKGIKIIPAIQVS